MGPVKHTSLRADPVEYLVPDLQTKLKGIGVSLKVNVVAAISGFKDALGPQSPEQKGIPGRISGSAEFLNSRSLGKASILQQISVVNYLVHLGIRAIRTDPLLVPVSLVPAQGGTGKPLKRSLTAGHQQT
jgi:hypothetical protein